MPDLRARVRSRTRRSPRRTTSRPPPARRCSPAAATPSTRSSPRTSRSASSRRTSAGTAATSSRIVWDGELHGLPRLGALAGRRPPSATVQRAARRAHAVHRRRHRSRSPVRSPAGSSCSSAGAPGSFGELAAHRDPLRPRRLRGHADGARPTSPPPAASTRTSTPGRPSTATSRRGRSCASPRSRARSSCSRPTDPTRTTAGPIADAIAAAVQEAGGDLDPADLAGARGGVGAPLRAVYRDVEVAELPPPTQGVTVLEILRILDGFDLARRAGAEREHLLIEAVKLALARPRRARHRSRAHAAPGRRSSSTTSGSTRGGHASTRRGRVDPGVGARSGAAPRTSARPTATGCS